MAYRHYRFIRACWRVARLLHDQGGVDRMYDASAVSGGTNKSKDPWCMNDRGDALLGIAGVEVI